MLIRNIVIFIASFKQDCTYLNGNSLFEKLNIEQIVNNLEQDGIYQGLYLPEKHVTQILKYIETKDCYADGNSNYPFKHYQHQQAEQNWQKSIMRGEYLDQIDDCSVFKELTEDYQIKAIASQYLKTKPVLMETRLWWNFVVDETNCDLRKGARTFHYDLDDYRCLAFFFYLTDVDTQSGSHVCVRGSHRRKKLRHLLSSNLNRSDREIIDNYGEESLVEIKGKAGTGFIEDKFTFHKGNSPQNKKRLVMYLQYGINQYQNNYHY